MNQINNLYTKSYIPDGIHYVANIIYGRFACYNWGDIYLETNPIPQSILEFYNAFSKFEKNSDFDYSKGISLKNFLKISKEANKNSTIKQVYNEETGNFYNSILNNKNYPLRGKSTHKCIFKNLNENFTTFAFHNKIGGYIPEKIYSVNYDKDNHYYSVYVIYANSGKYQTENTNSDGKKVKQLILK